MKKTLLPALLVCSSLALTETAVAQGQILAKWPLTANNSDDASVRATGITANTPVFRRFVLSDGQLPTGGTGLMAFPAYSSAGQAFAPRADGGAWSSTVSPTNPVAGTGSTPRRRFYEQFSITAASAISVDSILFNAAVHNSDAGKVALAYSLSNFTTDSAVIAPGGIGPFIDNTTYQRPGGVLLPNENGTFGINPTNGNAGDIAYNGAILPKLTTTILSGTIPDQYRFSLAGAAGVNVPASRTLSIRLYFAVGSSSVGRYALLRNVTIKGRTALATRTGVATNLMAYPNPAQNQVVVPHAALGQDARITVYNAVGAPVASAVAKAGSSQTAVSLQSLAAGLYLVEYANGTERSSARVVKE